MSRLVRLYPRSWRERYGEDLTVLLEDRPPGPSEALDLLLGAFDAHIHHRTAGSRAAARSRTLTLAQIGASAAIAGGALWIVTLPTALREGQGLMGWTMVLVSVTLTLFAVALAALSTVQARAHRSLVWASFVLPVVGVVLLVAGTSAQFAVGDRPRLEEFTPYAFWILGTLLATLGCTLFGAISAIAGGLTHSSAVLLSVGGIVQILAIFATDHARDEWLMLLGAAAFGLGWVVVGLGAWRGERYRPTDEIRRDPPHE